MKSKIPLTNWMIGSSLIASTGLIVYSLVAQPAMANCSGGNCDLTSPSVNPQGTGSANQLGTNIGNTNSGSGVGTGYSNQQNAMVNVQNNYAPAFSENAFGGGIVCQEASIQIGAYGSGDNWSGTFASGLSGQISIPLGNGGKMCKQLAGVKIQQARLDTCLAVAKAGYRLDSAKYPEYAYCDVLMPVAVAQPTQPLVAEPINKLTVDAVPEPEPKQQETYNKPIRALY